MAKDVVEGNFGGVSLKGSSESMANLLKHMGVKTKVPVTSTAKESRTSNSSSPASPLLVEDDWNLSRGGEKWRPTEDKKFLKGWSPRGSGMGRRTRKQYNMGVAKLLKRKFSSCGIHYSALMRDAGKATDQK